MKVVLSWPECEQAATAGVKRRLLAMHDGRAGRRGFSTADGWASDIEAAAAELAVARATLGYWHAWARRPEDVPADVGARVEVRWRSRPEWDLVAHRGDKQGHYLVLVTGAIPEFDIVGWIAVEDAKADRYFGDPHGTGNRSEWWVPQADLNRDLDELVDAVSRAGAMR